MKRIDIKAKGNGQFQVTDKSGDRSQTYDQNKSSAASSLSAVGGLSLAQAEELLSRMDQQLS